MPRPREVHDSRADHPATRASGVTISDSPVVNQTVTVSLAGGPADADVVFTIETPAGGVTEKTAHTDDSGDAAVEVVPGTTGTLTAAVTQASMSAIGAATASVSGSAATAPLTLTGIDPTSSPAGPPDSFVIVATGTGFDINTRASFGAYSQAEEDAGLGVKGDPKWEAGTRFISDTAVSIDITQDLFPNPDPAIPVSVGQPDGTTAGPINFAFT